MLCLLAGSAGGFLLLNRDDDPVLVTAPGGFEVRAPGAAFPGDDPELAVAARSDGFLDVFGLDPEQRVLSVTADDQPQGAVEVVLPYDPVTVPEGSVPVVYYLDEDSGLWLPIETRADPARGRLVGTTNHFTDFATGLLDGFLDVAETVVNGAATGVDWLAYQVAGATGARAQEPSCGQRPDWVTGVQATHDPGFRLSAALFACPETVEGNPDRLRLRIAINRAYGFALTAQPPAASIVVEPTPSLSGSLGRTFGESFRAEDGTVIAPGTSTVVMEFDRPETDVRQLIIEGHMTAQSTLIDALMLALDVGSIFASGDPTEKVAAFECAVALIQGTADLDSRSVFLGTWSKLVDDCLGPAAAGVGDDLLGRVGAGISVGLSMGQVGQSFLDRERDLLDGVRLQVGVLPPGSFAGRWEGGPVPQPGARVYGTVVDLTDDNGLLAAAVSYPELTCAGRWTQVSRSSTQADLLETITDDTGYNCVPQTDIALTLRPDGRLVVRYNDSYEVALTRTGPPRASTPASDEERAVDEPPMGAVWLSDVLLDSGGAGTSGQVIDPTASVSGKRATHATGQWVGCYGGTAWAEYELAGLDRLTSWLGYRDFAEPDLITSVRVLVDDRPITTLEVGPEGLDVDLDLPPGQRLRLEASLLSGSCGPHSEGYLAWGNGALS
ncbi:hypothetical protein ACWKWC_01650 [Geodermatophilus nigrescens]